VNQEPILTPEHPTREHLSLLAAILWRPDMRLHEAVDRASSLWFIAHVSLCQKSPRLKEFGEVMNYLFPPDKLISLEEAFARQVAGKNRRYKTIGGFKRALAAYPSLMATFSDKVTGEEGIKTTMNAVNLFLKRLADQDRMKNSEEKRKRRAREISKKSREDKTPVKPELSVQKPELSNKSRKIGSKSRHKRKPT
jgi:hypothetical protein